MFSQTKLALIFNIMNLDLKLGVQSCTIIPNNFIEFILAEVRKYSNKNFFIVEVMRF